MNLLIFLILFIIIQIVDYNIDINNLNNSVVINSKDMERWFLLKKKKYKCGKMICYITTDNSSYYDAKVYNIQLFKTKIYKQRRKLYILCNTEALSRWKETRNIITGKNKNFDVLISYKLLISKNHFPFPYYMDIDKIITDGKESLKSVEDFMKRKDIVFIYKMPYPNRNKLCEMFNSKIKVDKYGLAFKDHLIWPNNASSDKYLLIKNYKFCLAIENTINQVKWGKMHSDTIDDDYVTEKLWDCMRGGSIPIYFGAKNIKKFYPTNMSIISASDFKNYDELIEYILSIKNNSKILSEYINWPYKYSREWYKRLKYYSISPCKLCNYIKKYRKE